MPHHARVTVPSEHTAAVADGLLAVYSARAFALAEYAERTDAQKLQDCRASLADADSALDVFGWDRGPRLDSAELTGTSRLVGEVLSCAVVDASQSFDAAFGEYSRGEVPLPVVAEASRQLGALLALFVAFEREQEV